MCLILFAYRVHPTYKLIVAANRDEYYNRPTASAHFWNDYPSILAGRDLLKMGTWMGITKSGNFAAITNYRNPLENPAGKSSRGDLVADFLKNDDDPLCYMKKVAKNRDQYPGFNLLAGDTDELYYYSNKENKLTKVEPGIYGLSNHLLNTEWPKVKLGKERLLEIIDGDELVDTLFSLLKNDDPAPDEVLPNTGITLQLERMLSPLFIKSETYGTRSSTVLLMTGKEMDYFERSYSLKETREQHYKIFL